MKSKAIDFVKRAVSSMETSHLCPSAVPLTRGLQA